MILSRRAWRALAAVYVLAVLTALVAHGAPSGACALLLPMTPRKRARDSGTGLPVKAAGRTATPCRHRAMTADESTPARGHESDDDESTPAPHDVEDWETLARDALASVLLCRRSRIDSAVQRMESDLRAGRGPREGDVRAVRKEIEELRSTVEDVIAANVEGVEPWERDGRHATYGQLADQLGLTVEELRDARERPDVE